MTPHSRQTRRTTLAAFATLGLAALLAGTPAGSQASHYWSGDAAAIAKAQRANGPALSGKFNLEAAPAATLADAIAAANEPAHVDPAAFNLQAYNTALSLGHTTGTWKQVGAGGGIVEDANRGATNDGRLRNTGIVLAFAPIPGDKTGNSVWAGTGGGLYKTTNGGSSWTRPASLPAMPFGGVAVDPNHPNYVYAGSGQAFQGGGEGGGLGVWVSHDGGKTFFHPAKNVRGNGTQQVAVSPNGTAFVATSGGLFRSTDFGATWHDVKLPTNAAHTAPYTNSIVGSWTSDVKVRPGHPDEIYAAVGYVAGQIKLTDGTSAAPGNGLYRSTNSGVSWVYMDVKQPGPLGWEQSPGESSDPIGRTKLAFSADGNDLWALVADAGNRSARKVADQAIPAGVGHDSSLNGIYHSTTFGPEQTTTWELKANSATLTSALGGYQPVLSLANRLGYNAGIQAWYNGWIAVDPRDKDKLLVGEEEVYASVTPATTPGLIGFRVIDRYASPCEPDCMGLPIYSGFSTHPDQHGFATIDTGSTTRLWIGNDGGFFRQDKHTTSDQAGWDNTSWFSAAHVNTLLPYRAVKGTDGSVIGGLQDNGTVKYYPGERDPVEICGGDGSGVAIARDAPNVFYCQENGSLSVTTNGGKTINDAGAPAGPAFTPAAFAMDPTSDDELTIGDTTLYQTLKGAASGSSDWKKVYDFPSVGAETVPGVSGDAPQASLAAVDTYGAAAYAAYSYLDSSSVTLPESALDRGLATNVKAGCNAAAASSSCWHAAKLAGMPGRQIQAVALNPSNVRQVYIATTPPSVVRYDLGGVNAPRILFSTDAGESVKDISGNLPRGNYWDVKVIGKRAYVAGDFGVFTAPVGSKTWSRLGSGIPVVRVFGLSLSGDRKELVASTYGLGVWTIPISKTGVTLPKAPAKTGNLGGSYGGGTPKGSGGSLATTGLGGQVPFVALLLLAAGGALAWRRRVARGL